MGSGMTSSKIDSKMDPKLLRNWLQRNPGMGSGITPEIAQKLTPKWIQNGSVIGSKMAPKWAPE